MSPGEEEISLAQASSFLTTHWSVLLAAAEQQSPRADEALERLCRAYWFPVYAFIRRGGHSAHDAEDLTQEFLAELIARRGFVGLDRTRGTFRSFLSACLKHFLAKDWRERKTLKRGGGRQFVPIDAVEAEERYAADLAIETDTAVLFDRRWAMAVLDQALTRLRDEQAAAGKGCVFEELRQFLTLASADSGHAEAAQRLQMSVGAVTTAVHRLRHRYRELVREALAQTVNTPLELEEEMQYLLRALSQ
jgi:RNA polymerase sigma-70 factor (ECF subfamily)